ncbi:MAG: hypothetical protein OEN55_12090 [Alphaproteobacteria bacterium]|nr:hypothetical protein [Alphaproteobacteria bacterium]
MAMFFRILSRIIALFGVGLIAIIGILWVDGQNVSDSAGAIWAKMHAPSLLAFQNLVQRHMGIPGVWDNYIVPALEQQAWIVIVATAAVLLVLALLLATFGRNRPRSGNAFQNTPPE